MEIKANNKIPLISISFWVMKICATTLGETAGDLLSMTLKVGYAISSIILLSFFFISLGIQLFSKKYNPIVFWFVILTTSTAGTTLSDYMDRTLKMGYATGSLILICLLMLVLLLWKYFEKSVSVTMIKSRRGEIFYWTAILVSNTLGTALGDYLADSSGLGFSGGAMLIGSLLLLIVLAHYYTKFSAVLLFWLAFILTRPFGASLGDVLTKPYYSGGLDLGTAISSTILASTLAILIVIEIKSLSKRKKTKSI